jgi:uncharacterized membrane protein YphA (DoxX/SURF4 family)
VQKFGKPGTGGKGQAAALVIIRIAAGVAIFFFGFNRATWLLDSNPLATQLADWLPDAPAASRWYLERVLPGAPVFARLIPAGAMLGGIALVLGCWTRMAAGLSLLVVLSIHVADGSMFRYEYLTDAGSLTLAAALLGLLIGGGRLPLSLRK